MASSSRTSTRSGTARRPKEQPRSWPVPVLSRAELACAFAQALDLGEGRPPGHAARICYIALNLAEASGLSQDERRTVFYSALLHDAGATPASAAACRDLDLAEEAIFACRPDKSPQQLATELAPSDPARGVDLLYAHPGHGGQVAKDLGFGDSVQSAIAAHHERWDGSGYPEALEAGEIPVAGRITGAADLIESVIADETNPLAARRRIVGTLAGEAGRQLDPKLARHASDLVRRDSFWLGLHDEALIRALAERYPEDDEDTGSPIDVHTFATVLADLADAKGQHTGAHSRRTAELVDSLATELNFAEGRKELLSVAALVSLSCPLLLGNQFIRQTPRFRRVRGNRSIAFCFPDNACLEIGAGRYHTPCTHRYWQPVEDATSGTHNDPRQIGGGARDRGCAVNCG